jgi:hypothetical protein
MWRNAADLYQVSYDEPDRLQPAMSS